MTSKDKQLLELFTKFLNHQKCHHARFEVDSYNYLPYRDRAFICMENEDFGNLVKSIINMNEVITHICEDNNSEIFDEDGDGGTLSEIYVDIYPKTRKINVIGNFSILKEIYEQSSSGSMDIPENILNQLISSGITYAYIDFSGGGDSGYIEEEFRDQDSERFSLSQFEGLETFLLQLLDEYGDWYNNEGAQGDFVIDVPEKTATYNVTPNDYVYEEYKFFELDY